MKAKAVVSFSQIPRAQGRAWLTVEANKHVMNGLIRKLKAALKDGKSSKAQPEKEGGGMGVVYTWLFHTWSRASSSSSFPWEAASHAPSQDLLDPLSHRSLSNTMPS